MTFHAKFPGKCTGCGDRIEVGDDVEFVDSDLVHPGCEPRPVVEPIRRPVCPECFTETDVNGECACVN